jgi:hypothetical protein
MRRLAFLSPLFLVAGLHVACSADDTRSAFVAETLPDAGGPPGAFDEIDSGVEAGSNACAETKVQISRTPVVIEFVVDESTSMNTGDKWEAARDALLAAFADMQTTADPSTFVGVYLYPKNDEVDPGTLADPAHYDDLVDAVNHPSATGSSTPTEDALKTAYEIVEDFVPPVNSGLTADKMDRFVILFSDGVPNGGEGGKTACENLAESKFEAQPPKGPILTFSVGIGPFPSTSGYDAAFMGRLAQKGGTAPQGCDPLSTDPSSVCHFQITPGDDPFFTKQALLDAITKIRELTVSCEFAFTATEGANLNDVKVEITTANGTKVAIPKDTANGWSFDDPQAPKKVILNGEACDASTATVTGQLDVTIGCKGAS